MGHTPDCGTLGARDGVEEIIVGSVWGRVRRVGGRCGRGGTYHT